MNLHWVQHNNMFYRGYKVLRCECVQHYPLVGTLGQSFILILRLVFLWLQKVWFWNKLS